MDITDVIEVIRTHKDQILYRLTEEDEAGTGYGWFDIMLEDESLYVDVEYKRRYELDQIEYQSGLAEVLTLSCVAVDQDGVCMTAQLVSPGLGVDYQEYAYR